MSSPEREFDDIADRQYFDDYWDADSDLLEELLGRATHSYSDIERESGEDIAQSRDSPPPGCAGPLPQSLPAPVRPSSSTHGQQVSGHESSSVALALRGGGINSDSLVSASSQAQGAQQRASELSLAAALFGWPHAEGFFSPEQLAPDSWRRVFLALADAGVWLGLFRSCRSGRDLALLTAPKAHLHINASKSAKSKPGAATWKQRLGFTKQCLGIRGDLPTHLEIM